MNTRYYISSTPFKQNPTRHHFYFTDDKDCLPPDCREYLGAYTIPDLYRVAKQLHQQGHIVTINTAVALVEYQHKPMRRPA